MNKFRILQQYLKTKYRLRFSTREQVKQFHEQKITKHLLFVIDKSPFYRQLYTPFLKEIENGDLASLPIINKEVMMENFDTLNTASISKKEAFHVAFEAEKTRNFSPTIRNITVGLSSGTSGNRGVFLVSEEEQTMWAGSIIGKVLPSSILHKHTIAFFLRANSNLYEATKNKRIAFHFFDLLDSFHQHIARLNEVNPSILIAPPSMLRKIAHWQQEGLIMICPKKIISVAEVLEDIDREFISTIFQQTVHQVYQCTEGFLATTCTHGTLHINEDLVHIEKEYLDQDRGIFVPIITDFTRKTQPIIRYRLNDILIEKKTTCACGSPFLALERIDGRCDDIFIGISELDKSEISIFPDFIRRAIMFTSNEIQEFKVIQHSTDKIEIKLKILPEHFKSCKSSLIQELHRLWSTKKCVVPHFFFSHYDIELYDKKLKRIESLIKHGENV
ncbi:MULTISPECIES: F390 synthetase-related protein [Bacillus cereus group]|uniref:F390 synthetase-related protein n=1 Tax=Bacillus cereus group TaxID=86661 RepID=UPI0002D26B6C|nr:MULTISPECIES: F390 synthetase-related protein [Bacillus cereus group]PFA18699.1 adenylate cyclase [Bacillus cereus]PGZ18343.1 adenylate cyclase [Bacillus cereus]